jgi:hypothetical protein
MLNFAVGHVTAINSVTSNRDMKLQQYKLSKDEWDIPLQLQDVLKVCFFYVFQYLIIILHYQIFKDATLFFSRGTPNITTVIPAMDHINEHLTTAAIDNCYPLAIKAALAISKKALNCYYDKTDNSEVFRIAMGTNSLFILNLFLICG